MYAKQRGSICFTIQQHLVSFIFKPRYSISQGYCVTYGYNFVIPTDIFMVGEDLMMMFSYILKHTLQDMFSSYEICLLKMLSIKVIHCTFTVLTISKQNKDNMWIQLQSLE